MRVLARVLLALLIVVTTTSAYVRLAQSGLSCAGAPDCYATKAARAAADQSTASAVARTLHRMSASAAGAVVLGMLLLGWRAATSGERAAIVLLGVLAVGLATLGIYTPSTLPAVTLGNLLGGMTMVAAAAWLVVRLGRHGQCALRARLRTCIGIAFALFALQVAAGGMISAQYASLACDGFPLCDGRLWPPGASLDAFDPLRALPPPAEATARAAPARQAVVVAHRLLAVPTLIVLAWLGVLAWRAGARGPGAALVVLAALQLALGIGQSLGGAPLVLAVLHNVAAACVVIALGMLAATAAASAST